MQEKLFYDDEFQALRDMIESGQGYKKTAGYLWPGMKQDSAYAKLKACVQEAGDQRLKFGEIISAMVFNQCYAPLFFACDATQFERPTPRAPEDEKARLQRNIIEAAASFKRDLDRLERLTQSPLKAVG